MDKRISIFIFTCFLLTWAASASGSDSGEIGAEPPNKPSISGESGPNKSQTTTSASGIDPEEPGAVAPNKPSISGESDSTKSPTTASASDSDLDNSGAEAPNKPSISGESGSTKSPTNAPGTSLSTAGSSSSPTSAKDSAESGSSSSDKSTTIASSPASKISTASQTDTSTTQELGTASPTKITTLSKDSSTTSPPTVPKITVTASKNHTGSGENRHEEEKSKITSDKRFLWILIPAVCVPLAAITYWKSKCKKVQHRPEMTDNGTENASFQRTDSNKDGVMLLGVSKTPSGAENVI